ILDSRFRGNDRESKKTAFRNSRLNQAAKLIESENKTEMTTFLKNIGSNCILKNRQMIFFVQKTLRFGRRAKRRRASSLQNGFAQSLEYPTNRNFQNFLSQTEALPRGFASRQGRVPQGGTRQNPTARQTKRKPLFASKTI